MISPISSISGYSVQAIYGNPASTNAIHRVGKDTTANRAMMTVSKEKENEIQSQSTVKEEPLEEIKRNPLKGVASGGEAELLKQLHHLATAVGRGGVESEEEAEDKTATITAAVLQNPFASQLSNQYENNLLEMGYQQNIRDKVSSSLAQSQLAEATQKMIEPQDGISQVSATEKAENFLGSFS